MRDFSHLTITSDCANGQYYIKIPTPTIQKGFTDKFDGVHWVPMSMVRIIILLAHLKSRWSQVPPCHPEM